LARTFITLLQLLLSLQQKTITAIGSYNSDRLLKRPRYSITTKEQNNDATSSIQTQLNSKQPSGGYEPAFTKNTRLIKTLEQLTAGTIGDGAVVAILQRLVSSPKHQT
jgi:hypothetical protein